MVHCRWTGERDLLLACPQQEANLLHNDDYFLRSCADMRHARPLYRDTGDGRVNHTFSKGEQPYITKYRRQPSDHTSVRSSMLQREGTSNSSGAR